MGINAHPELPEFEYIRPASLAEASRFLAEHPGEARPLLGGTDIFVRMRDGFWHDKYLVDIKCLDGTTQLRFHPNANGHGEAGLTVGAAVNMNQVMAYPEVQRFYPLLAEACRSVASYQLRTRATIVGNICNASPAGDTIGASMVLDGVLKVHGLDGFRDVPLAGFFRGPGKTQLQPGDIALAITFPPPQPGGAGTYLKLGRNTWSDLSIVGVTAFGYPVDSGYRFRIALASVAPVPLVPSAAEEYLAAHAPGPETFQEAARLAGEACTPIDDVRGSARYRKAMVRRLTEKALGITWQRIQAGVQAAPAQSDI
jgi:carbon-monoxide dehydrogenase medium subunit